MSLIEPYVLWPTAEESPEETAESIAEEKHQLSHVDTHVGGESLKDGREEEVQRGFTRFIDFLAKQKQYKDSKTIQKQKGKKNYRALKLYHNIYSGRFPSDYIGTQLKTYT